MSIVPTLPIPGLRPVQIIIGGGVATVALLVISEAGSAGAELAEGLAVITMVSSVLLWGTPVFDFASTLFGSKATGPTGTTTPTTPTTTSSAPTSPSTTTPPTKATVPS